MSSSSSRLLRRALLGSLLLLRAVDSSALSLMDAYDAALNNDPVYRAALYEKQAGDEYQVIGKAYLLPNVSANYSTNKNQVDISRFGSAAEHRSYPSDSGAIQLRQPLFNLDGMARYRQGKAQTLASDAQFQANDQDLIVRLASLYVAASYAEYQFALAVAQRDTYAEQRKTNDRLFAKGEGTVTDMMETQAKFDLAEAQVIEARDAMSNARNELVALVGQDVSRLNLLRDDFHVSPMQPASIDEWKAIALTENPAISVQRYSVEVANQEVMKNRAAHSPRLDLVMNVNRTNSDTPDTYRQDATGHSIGVQLIIPIYSGGSVSALTRQAAANHEKAKAIMESKSSDVFVDLHKQYNATLNGQFRIDALMKSVSSARLLIDATQKSVKAGMRTNLDSLNAQQKLFEAKLDLASARYNYLVSFLRLRKAAGTLSASDLQTVATQFEPGRQRSITEQAQ